MVVSISHNCVIFIPFGKFFHLLAQDIIGKIYVRYIVRYLGISLTKKAQIVIGLILIGKLVHGYPTKYPFHTIYSVLSDPNKPKCSNYTDSATNLKNRADYGFCVRIPSI